MRLWQLQVHRFRGIRRLDWQIPRRVVGLVGAGDSTKTTILDAIGLLTTPRISVPFTDSDFYAGDASAGLRIEGTIGELPASLLADDRMGLELRGVDPATGVVQDEPGDMAPVVTIRLDVSESLEPTWSVVNDRNPDGRPLAARDRALLGVSRVGDNPDRQFTWARGTALARISESTGQVQRVITEAYRQARLAVRDADLGDLTPSLAEAQVAATLLGAGPAVKDLDARLDASATGAAALGLHSAGIPVGAAGLGTRRLLALGLELLATQDGAILAIDEIESGLEPHRLRHLLRTLRRRINAAEGEKGQVVFTTHAAVVLEELNSSELNVVHTKNGDTVVRPVPDDLTSTLRAIPEAFLSRRVVVCEGKTEIGVVRGHDETWSGRHESRALAHVGVATALGQGSQTGMRASQFADLGYQTLVLADSDATFEPNHNDLENRGIPVLRWDGDCAIEERCSKDLSWGALTRLYEVLLGEGHADVHLVDTMAGTPAGVAALARLGFTRSALGKTLDEMREAGMTDEEVRLCFGQASKKHSWFKRIDLGEMLGGIIANDTEAQANDLGDKLSTLERWCYAD